MRIRRHERGIALVVVLWVGLLVSAIAAAFILDTRNSTQLTRNFLDNAEARALADGGIHLAIHELIRPEAEPRWRKDGSRYQRKVPGGTLDIMIENEVGKIDINLASDDLLAGLFRSKGFSDERSTAFIQAIDQYRKGEHQLNRQISSGATEEALSGGATQQLLRSARRQRSERNGSGRDNNQQGYFHTVDSLSLILGINPEEFNLLSPALTVFGRNGLDYKTSPRQVLLAVPGITAEAIDAFLRERGSEDDEGALESFLTEGDARKFWEESSGNFLTVRVLAKSENGAKFVRVAIVEISDQGSTPFIIKEWRKGDARTFPPTDQDANNTDARSGETS